MMAVMMTMIILIIAIIISAVIAIAINYSVPDLETGCTRGEPEHKGAAAALSRCWGWGEDAWGCGFALEPRDSAVPQSMMDEPWLQGAGLW